MATGLNNGINADIINMSMGCYCDYTPLRNAVDAAAQANVLVVAAAGNCGTTINNPNAGCTATSSSDTVIHPAKYASVIAVASVTSSNTRSSFSSVGPSVELSAPGSSIKSTVPTSCGTSNCNASGYNFLSGTSMATPHVAGLAALIKAANPSMTAGEIRTRLQQTATDLGSAGRDSSYGYGIINAVAAVGGSSPPPPPPPPTGSFLACTQQAPVTSSSGDNNGYQTNAANACNDNSVFAVDTNSGSSSTTYGGCTGWASTYKDKHHFSNFNANLNGGAGITGIEVRLDARVDSTSGSPSLCVQLSWNGGSSWTAARQTSTLTTSEQSYILGSSSDTWGRTWTADNLSNANFRVRVTDYASNTARDFSLDFVGLRVTSTGGTPAAPDSTPPTVTTTSPAAGASGVATNSTVSATFSEAMDPATISGSSFTIRPTSSGTNLPGNVTYSGNVATFTPSSAFAMNTSYTATVTTAVRDANGVAMAAAKTWSFTTLEDNGAPTVTSMSPSSGSTGVATNSTIRATFSEPMNEASVETSGRFVVRVTNGGANVAGTVVYANNAATFTPSSPLASNTNYTVTLSTLMTDVAGNPLTLPGSWTFTTVSGLQACTAPIIVSRSDTSSSGGGTVSFSWSPVPGATS